MKQPACRYFRPMKQSILISLTTVAFIQASCGDGRFDAAKRMAAAEDSARSAARTDLSVHQIPLVLEIPGGVPSPSIVWKDAAGKLEVRAGDHYALEIQEAPSDMAGIKADLDRDLLKRNSIVEETPDLLVYRSEFPDDTTLVFHHFHRSITVGTRTFQVSDTRNGTPFTLEDVRAMAASVLPREAL